MIFRWYHHICGGCWMLQVAWVPCSCWVCVCVLTHIHINMHPNQFCVCVHMIGVNNPFMKNIFVQKKYTNLTCPYIDDKLFHYSISKYANIKGYTSHDICWPYFSSHAFLSSLNICHVCNKVDNKEYTFA